jgi:hypothetical protein
VTRAPEWQQRLRAFLDQAALWQYDPVSANCAHFILGAVGALAGKDPEVICRELRIALPADEAGVRELLVKRRGLRGIATAYFGGKPRGDMLNAREGDIAVLDGDDGETLGVVEGGGVLCVAADRGLLRIRLTQAKGFWAL